MYNIYNIYMYTIYTSYKNCIVYIYKIYIYLHTMYLHTYIENVSNFSASYFISRSLAKGNYQLQSKYIYIQTCSSHHYNSEK